MITQTTGTTYRLYDRSLLMMQGAVLAGRHTMRASTALLDAAGKAMRWPLANVAAQDRTGSAGGAYASPAAPASGPAAGVAHVLDEAHADLAQPDLTALLLAVRGAASSGDRMPAPVPPAARPYQRAIGALMDTPDAESPLVWAGVADYVDDVAARPPGAGAPRD